MKKVTKALLVALIFNFQLSIFNSAQAQIHQAVYLNGNIPTGDFGSTVSSSQTTVPLMHDEVGKAATVGFGLGYRVSYPIEIDESVGSVSPFANVDFLWNTIGGAWSDKYSDAYYSTPTYFNIPLFLGVNFTYVEVTENITPFGEFGFGTDFLWITSEGGTTPTGSNEKYSYKPTFAFAWMLGAGAYFGQHISTGIYYYGLGTHNIDYTDGTIEDHNWVGLTIPRQRRSVGSIMLRIGFHF